MPENTPRNYDNDNLADPATLGRFMEDLENKNRQGADNTADTTRDDVNGFSAGISTADVEKDTPHVEGAHATDHGRHESADFDDMAPVEPDPREPDPTPTPEPEPTPAAAEVGAGANVREPHTIEPTTKATESDDMAGKINREAKDAPYDKHYTATGIAIGVVCIIAIIIAIVAIVYILNH